MQPRRLTGSRIRERRIDLGIRQGDLAADVGISASYLNLIEHNRRKIGGKLLIDLARALELDPVGLTDGAEQAMAAQLRTAALADPTIGVDLPRAEDFAERFPGWAGLVIGQARRIGALEDRIKALTDRLSHDPQLAASLHEVISAATAIRSTASILNSGDPIDADWQARFHRNIHNDAIRLAESSRSLVAFLDAPVDQGGALSPQEEVAAYLELQGHHLPYLEEGNTQVVAPALRSPAAGKLLAAWRDRYLADAQALPLSAFAPAAKALDYEPAALAAQFRVPLGTVLRRLASLPESAGHPAFGLVICDGAGVILHQRGIGGMTLPYAGACSLWPVFTALARPYQPLRAAVALPGDGGARLVTWAIAEPQGTPRFDAPQPIEAVMLMRSAPAADQPHAAPVGQACRICPRRSCEARREPSILFDPTDARRSL